MSVIKNKKCKRMISVLICSCFFCLSIAAPPLFSEEAPKPYDESLVDARAYIQESANLAKASDKDLLIVFGGNWCPDCIKLASFFDNDLKDFVTTRFIVVHIDVGRFNKNIDVMESYGLPKRMGIPALVIISRENKQIAFGNGQFSKARGMSPDEIKKLLSMNGGK